MLKNLFFVIISTFICLFSSPSKAELIFHCDNKNDLAYAEQKLTALLVSYKIPVRFINFKASHTSLTISSDVLTDNTLHISELPYLGIKKEQVLKPSSKGLVFTETVSKAEITLAYISPGRKSEFSGDTCGVTAFEESVGLRQAIVLWAQELQWGWPEGGPAKWNKKYWNKGTPVSMSKTVDAFKDALLNQSKYEIGCYTATKMVIGQAYLDYYSRIKPNSEKLKSVLRALWRDNDPLIDVEPEIYWSFEPDFEPKKSYVEGKLLNISGPASGYNFIPGDWSYFLNTDLTTYAKTGYEGSNSIYLGKNRFDDYYFDNEGSYTFEEKLDEVYQWKHNVFSRSRHINNIVALPVDKLYPLAKPPEEGGILIPYRLVPKILLPN